MKKRYVLSAILALAVCFLLFGRGQGIEHEISDVLGVDVTDGEVLSEEDSHGGFHGDGQTAVTLRFADDAVWEEIAANADWQPLPLTGELSALAYGLATADGQIGPYLEEGVIPRVENGAYCFIDRHAQADTPLLERSSFNFTLAVYDADTRTLYYTEYDT